MANSQYWPQSMASAALMALALLASACSGEGLGAGELEPAENSTSTTAEPTTTTTLATTTTLSKQARVEAEIAQLVTDFWLAPFDTSKGKMGLEYLTGPIAQRSEEAIEAVTAAGQIARDGGQKRIEVVNVEVDLENGHGEVKVCKGSSNELVDAGTLEPIGEPADPNFLTTSIYVVQETSEGWKISELIASSTSGSPELCEIGS